MRGGGREAMGKEGEGGARKRAGRRRQGQRRWVKVGLGRWFGCVGLKPCVRARPLGSDSGPMAVRLGGPDGPQTKTSKHWYVLELMMIESDRQERRISLNT
jgi:hypothetical protein